MHSLRLLDKASVHVKPGRLVVDSQYSMHACNSSKLNGWRHTYVISANTLNVDIDNCHIDPDYIIL
jgi:hypothetical protein